MRHVNIGSGIDFGLRPDESSSLYTESTLTMPVS